MIPLCCFVTVSCVPPVNNLIANHAQLWHGSFKNGYQVGIPARVGKSLQHYTKTFDSIALFHCGIGRQEVLLMHQSAKEYPSFPLGNRLYIRLGFSSRGKRFVRRVRKRKITRPIYFGKQNKLFFVYDFFSQNHKQSISWTFLNDAMAISAKEMPKNHTDKERFAAASSCIDNEILTSLLPRKRWRSSPGPLSATVLEAVASLKVHYLSVSSHIQRALVE